MGGEKGWMNGVGGQKAHECTDFSSNDHKEPVPRTQSQRHIDFTIELVPSIRIIWLAMLIRKMLFKKADIHTL